MIARWPSRSREIEKKVPELFGKVLKKGLSLHPLPIKSTAEAFETGSEKNLKKVPKSFGDSEICLTFAPLLNDEGHSSKAKKVLKNF